ncbi:MAG: hypothetical protein P1P89_22350 [Desulfobacterales bacterium]|nr:hypothetical protein [Desulfobacterales bacterium]
MKNLAIFCADVGSIKAKKFGWAAITPDSNAPESGPDIEEFVSLIYKSIGLEHKVAIGFECPLFVPMRSNPLLVNSSRKGEGNRSWSASAGTGALATGLVEVLWVMNQLTEKLGKPPIAELNWDAFQSSNTIFLWEAFVTSTAKGSGHSGDAIIAIDCFVNALPQLSHANAIDEHSVLSLVGAAALRAGWSTDLNLLSMPCIVIKA